MSTYLTTCSYKNFCFGFYLRTGSYCVAQVGFNLQSFCLSLPRAGVTGVPTTPGVEIVFEKSQIAIQENKFQKEGGLIERLSPLKAEQRSREVTAEKVQLYVLQYVI